ncbi:MAG: glycosyltransferase family 39 protein [bacterium]
MSRAVTADAARGRAPGAALALALVGVAVAAAAQWGATRYGWASAAAFVFAALLFGLSARRLPDSPEGEAAPPGPLPARFLILCAIGAALCGAAGILVYMFQPRLLTHLVWAAGLLTLATAAFSAPRGENRLAPLTTTERGALAAVLVIAALLLCWQVASVPTEVHGDDAEVGLDAVRLLADFDLFGAGWFELPRFHAFPTAIGLQLFGINLLGLRATSAALGLLGVGLLFAVVRRLWSVELGLLAALLLAGQRFYIHLSRAGYHYIDTPVLSLLAVWLFLRLWQERRLDAAIWCGIALGLGIQTYYASRLVPPLLALTWVSFLFPLAGALTARAAVDSGVATGGRRLLLALRARAPSFAVIVLVAVAVAGPLFGFFAHDWGAFWERTRDTSMFTPAARHHLAFGYGTENLAAILAIQLRAALTLFNRTTDTSYQYGFEGALFEPASAVLFVLGLGLVCARWRERRMRLLLLWTALPLIAGAALTIDTPFYPRISGLVPFAVLFVGLALTHLLRVVRSAAVGRAGGWATAGLGAAAVGLILATNARTYFVDYAPRYRISPSVEIADFVRGHGAGKTTYMVGGAPAFFIRHGAITFLTYGYKTRDIEHLDAFLRGQPLDPQTSTFVIMPHGSHLLPSLEAAVGPLDLQTHRDRSGEVAFLTAVPAAAHDTADPPERLVESAQPSAAVRLFGHLLAIIQRLAVGGLAAAGLLALGVALYAAHGRPRRPGVRTLREPLRPRLARWRGSLFGPDALEHRLAPPGWAVALVLALIVALAFGLRTYRLTELPAGFFCDEAGNGFNTFCLLHAGQDENGTRWPLYVWSFGVSYKNPVFIYSTLPLMGLLGASELAVRLTAALYGTATVLALFFLGRALMGSLTGLAAALLLAVLPWHLHFSRIGFELITLPLFFILGLTCLVRWTHGRRTLAAAAVLFGLCLYTYVPAKLFVPLFLAGAALLYRRALLARWRESLLAAAALLLTALPVAIFDLAHRAAAASYFENTTILASDEPWLAVARRFAGNYAAFFSRTFLFASSNDRILRHSVSDHGELYWCLLPLLGLGIVTALLRRDRALRLPLLWLALYPVAAALMNEIPSASRGFIGAPAFALIAAIGTGAGLRLAGRVRRPRFAHILQGGLIAAGVVVLGVATARYWVLYRDDYPLYSAKEYTGFQYGHRQVLNYFRHHYDEYDLLLLSARRSNQPDVFLRFYDATQRPQRPGEVPPFEHGDKLVASSAEAYDHFLPGRHMLFAVLPEEVPLFADGEVVDRIIAPDGTAAFVIVAATQLKEFISTWMVGGPYPENDTSPPPSWTPEAVPEPSGGVAWELQDRLFAGVPLNDFFTPNAEHTCAWAVNFVSSETPRELRVVAGFDDTGEVWVNGARAELTPAANPEFTLVDSSSGTLQLAAGRNTLAVRSCDDTGDWRFYFRLENLDGTPAEGLSWTYGPRHLPE